MAKWVTVPPLRVPHTCLCSPAETQSPTTKEKPVVKLAVKMVMLHQALQYPNIVMLLVDLGYKSLIPDYTIPLVLPETSVGLAFSSRSSL